MVAYGLIYRTNTRMAPHSTHPTLVVHTPSPLPTSKNLQEATADQGIEEAMGTATEGVKLEASCSYSLLESSSRALTEWYMMVFCATIARSLGTTRANVRQQIIEGVATVSGTMELMNMYRQ